MFKTALLDVVRHPNYKISVLEAGFWLCFQENGEKCRKPIRWALWLSYPQTRSDQGAQQIGFLSPPPFYIKIEPKSNFSNAILWFRWWTKPNREILHMYSISYFLISWSCTYALTNRNNNTHNYISCSTLCIKMTKSYEMGAPILHIIQIFVLKICLHKPAYKFLVLSF
jgi:hypothetical protein